MELNMTTLQTCTADNYLSHLTEDVWSLIKAYLSVSELERLCITDRSLKITIRRLMMVNLKEMVKRRREFNCTMVRQRYWLGVSEMYLV